jgi:hypothetical protein
MFLRNVGLLSKDYSALYPTRRNYSKPCTHLSLFICVLHVPLNPHSLNKQDTNTMKCGARGGVAVNPLQVRPPCVAERNFIRAQNRNAVVPTADGHFALGLCVLHAARRNLPTQNRLCYAVPRMCAVHRANRPRSVLRTACHS